MQTRVSTKNLIASQTSYKTEICLVFVIVMLYSDSTHIFWTISSFLPSLRYTMGIIGKDIRVQIANQIAYTEMPRKKVTVLPPPSEVSKLW